MGIFLVLLLYNLSPKLGLRGQSLLMFSSLRVHIVRVFSKTFVQFQGFNSEKLLVTSLQQTLRLIRKSFTDNQFIVSISGVFSTLLSAGIFKMLTRTVSHSGRLAKKKMDKLLLDSCVSGAFEANYSQIKCLRSLNGGAESLGHILQPAGWSFSFYPIWPCLNESLCALMQTE